MNMIHAFSHGGLFFRQHHQTRFFRSSSLLESQGKSFSAATAASTASTATALFPLSSSIKDLLDFRVRQAIEVVFPNNNNNNNKETLLSQPPHGTVSVASAAHGDYQSNVAMQLARVKRMKPIDLAHLIVQAMQWQDIADKVAVTGNGFITIVLGKNFVEEELWKRHNDRERLGITPVAASTTTTTTTTTATTATQCATTKERIVVDFSSPNVAKLMHVGHLRSSILGDSLCRVFELLGHEVQRVNHVGDWGTQFGMLIYYLKLFHPSTTTTTGTTTGAETMGTMQWTVAELMDCYRRAKLLFDESEEFKQASRQEVVQLQQGNSSSIAIWKQICALSRQEFQSVYDQLDIDIEERGESFYNSLLLPLVQELEEKNVIVNNNGTKCIFLEGGKYKNSNGDPLPIIVQKSDGGFLYATTDLAALLHRASPSSQQQQQQQQQQPQRTRLVYVTDSGQAQHFAMLFDAVRQFNLISNNNNNNGHSVELHHVPFGLVLGEDGKKIKTRSGDTVHLKDLLSEAILNAEKELKQRIEQRDVDNNSSNNNNNNNGWTEEELAHAAKTIGLSAVKYADLSLNRNSNYHFSFQRMLSLNGNTAPYMLYTYARIRGIQRKAEETVAPLAVNYSAIAIAAASAVVATGDERKSKLLLVAPEEIRLAKLLLRLDETVREVAVDYCPNKLCEYLFELSQSFNMFYEKCSVLHAANEATKVSRVALCRATADTLKLSLSLLGIQTLERL